MVLPQLSDNPLVIQLSFHKIIERYEQDAATGDGLNSALAKAILDEVANSPELKYGITSISQIEDNAAVIAHLLAGLFPEALTLNEIKAVSIPYQSLMFNHTQRFKNILEAAGPGFEFNIRGFDEHQLYVYGCCLALNYFYGKRIDFSIPIFYDIPDANGIIRHYRIMYNSEFMDVIPTDRAPALSTEDIDLLLDNYDNIALWKEKIPVGSFIIKGFALITLFDVTVENAISLLKDNLLINKPGAGLHERLQDIFSSIFKIYDISVGFTLFDKGENKFSTTMMEPNMHSFLLFDETESESSRLLCDQSYESLVMEHSYFAVSDMADFLQRNPGSGMADHFGQQDIGSFILAPVVKNGNLLGILEVVSHRTKELNSVIAQKLDIIMPYLVDTIDRKLTDFHNLVQAVIQNNYTTLHPSVNWKFVREAKNYIRSSNAGEAYTLKQIKFKDVYPLYGQVDIGNSSITRNLSVKNDLLKQLNHLVALIEQLPTEPPVIAADEHLLGLKTFVDELSAGIKADTEQQIQHYLETNVHPLLSKYYSASLNTAIKNYFEQADALTGDFHSNRRDYDTTLSGINDELTSIIDKRQAEIQAYYPHYYERFKTDGVEHNLYIGATITPTQEFAPIHLKRLRLWQLLVTAEMEIGQYYLKSSLPYHLGVTSLILVFSTPIAIRFRMDEKHFDIDGAYNVRYEVIKKRIDKAHIRNSGERITKQGTITIIYSKPEEGNEYENYLYIMQSAGILGVTIERFDVEDLQGVSGLKALRAEVLYGHKGFSAEGFSYEELYRQLN